ncbi:thiamine-phosphate kinase [Psychromonas ingrahamii 37]|uniref:Thiamine-monophosphate kinase n=1 Tax=Psychromonas ingrahamii (strain DSM 17664 / CCUG 51855 / 37) TaxID=357804 RepID=A1SWW7_PSYIN|nr:thiamine-phosphate kinase [Psychromonas ingrahamii]ABM03982.1 thiamine-phosphate kinase [Psychromonas ingrahamii 37]
MNLSEFDLIDSYFKRSTTVQNSGVALGIGDDCALLDIPEGYQLAVSTDSLVCGVHFFEDVDPYRLGYKALAVNLSDLAAMGALPKWVSLAITLPNGAMVNNNPNWLSEFTRGFFALADKFDVVLVGGDTTKGPLSITVSVKGIVPRGLALQRNKANLGDLICVSNFIGDGALGLSIKLNELAVTNPQYFVDALELTEPRVDLGILLRGLASSCIDISDGLTQDLIHILKASHCAANIAIESLPLSKTMRKEVNLGKLNNDEAVQYALTGGDDYELLFTISENNLRLLEQRIAQQTQPIPSLSVIGRTTLQQSELIAFFKEKQAVTYSTGGWDHFK